MRQVRTLLGAATLLASLTAGDMTVKAGGSSPAASSDGTGTVPLAA